MSSDILNVFGLGVFNTWFPFRALCVTIAGYFVFLLGRKIIKFLSGI